MASPRYPSRNVGPITYVYNGRKFTVVWPYFTYDSRGWSALQRAAMTNEQFLREYGKSKFDPVTSSASLAEGNARIIESAIQDAVSKVENDAALKAFADRKAEDAKTQAAMNARTYAQLKAPTTVINVSSPIPPPIKPFTTDIPKPATKVVVATVKKNSKKFVKNTPKKPNTTKQPSPGKPTPNKNPSILPPPPPPPPSPPQFSSDPDKIPQKPCPMCIASLDPNNRSYCPPCEPCPPGWYVGPEGQCLKCLIKGYVKGSRCAPCPPGTTGESIHTGCSQVGPDGRTYTFMA